MARLHAPAVTGPQTCRAGRKTRIFALVCYLRSGKIATSGILRFLDQIVGFVLAAAKWLALPVVTLLFLQWPLRTIVGTYSREANDLGQWLFALYVAASIAAATRAKAHLAADTISRNYSDNTRAMAGAGRRAVRPHSLVDHRVDDELEYRAEFDIAAGAFPGHRQSRLFHHQIGVVAAGAVGPDRGRDRTRAAGIPRWGADVAMTAVMPWLGLSLLVFVGLGVVFTGIPAAVVLLAAACFGAVVGAISGAAPVQLLGVLPERLINLLENDLLQAIPLYVLMGALINRLPLADALYRCSTAILRGPAAPVVSGFVLGALLGPMNGSVGASVLALSRVAEPRLAASGIALPRRAAIITVASTLGVVVPPSLVLILLGDAMLNAHTIAVTATGREDRVINTQDVFHGALVPAALYLAACIAIGWWFNRRVKPDQAAALTAAPRPTVQQAVLATVTVAAILILLGGVATGYFYAVEAAAMGGFILLVAGFVSGRLPLPVLNEVLRDALALTGALFFLLVAATTSDSGAANPWHRSTRRRLDSCHPGRHAERHAHRAWRDRAQCAGARRLRNHFCRRADRHSAAPHPRSGCALGRRSRLARPASKFHQSIDRLRRHDDAHRS